MDRKIMKELFLSGKYSDMTVTCGGRVFRLHQNVVCPQSAFFEAALNGNFAEAKSKCVNLPDDDPDAVECMLFFMYTEDYQCKPIAGGLSHESTGNNQEGVITNALLPSGSAGVVSLSHPGTTFMDTSLRVYMTAEKYGIVNLKRKAELELNRQASQNIDSPNFLGTVEKVLETLPPHDRVLRKVISKLLLENVSKFDKHALSNCLAALGVVVPDVLEGFLDQMASLRGEVASLSDTKTSLADKLKDAKQQLARKNPVRVVKRPRKALTLPAGPGRVRSAELGLLTLP